ncbi:probable splicing factor, arginine/serine-rich 7 isoform X2 [Plodia interpunctella]|uniref:probable splicing factor, arginine/serine-rich 7 isoform X2 n=1 Tax=Plodia interpunctella TaxID=58824 RepID=UPI00236854E2|nr:probable splicing factor, arginine/serine-rich 7 isoform X2 [Plodia interpunctella]
MCKSSKMVSGSTRVIQVTNIAPQATKDQMQTLFGYLGKIDDIRLYPTIRDVSCPVQSRICYVKYYDSATVNVAQHMTNTVFIDRALIVIPMQSGEIPDEHKALEMSNNGTLVPGLSGVEPRLPTHILNALEGMPPNQVIQTHDPKMIAAGLPPYPPLPATYDARKIEEIRRTVLVADVGALTQQQLIDHFCQASEVKYLRFCERDVDSVKYALVEMTEQEGVLAALQLNGSTIEGQTIKVHHATQSISKPQTKSNEAAQREIEEAMCRVKEAQNLISAAIDPVIGLLSKDKRSRSRSRSRRRSRSRSRRSRSRHRSKRSRSRSRHRSRRSRERHRHRSRSRSRHRSSRRSRSRSRHRSSRSKRDRSRDKDKKETNDKDKKDKSKSPPKDNEKEEKQEPKLEIQESETNGNGSENKSKASSPADDNKEVEKEKERSPSKKRSRSREKKRDRSRSRRRSRSRSRRKRSRSRRRSRTRDRKRSRSRERKRSRSKDRKRSRSRDRKRSRSRDRKRTRSRDRKRSRSRDRKRSRSSSRRSKSRSHRDSKTPHDRRTRERSPNLTIIEEKDTSVIDKAPDLNEEKNSPDNMDISNSP